MIGSNWHNFYSPKRYEMFNRCEREYFLHYNYAWGGHDIEVADKHHQKVHLLKQLKSADELIDYILNRAIQKLFFEAVDINQFSNIVANEAKFLKNWMLLGKYQTDHKYPILFDFYYQTSQIIPLFENFDRQLEQITKNLINDSIFQKLFFQDKLNFIHQEDKVANTTFGDTTLYGNIILVIHEKNHYNFLSFRPESYDENFTIFFHNLFALNKLKVMPHQLQSFLLNSHTGKIEAVSNLTVETTAVIDNMLQKYMALPSYELSNSWQEICKSNQLTKCKDCRFYEICE